MTVSSDFYTRWIEMWNGRTELAETLVTEDCRIHQAGSGMPGAQSGPAAIVAMIEAGRKPFKELTFTIEVEPIAEGDWLAARWNSRGIYRGGLPGTSAPEGTEVAFGGNDIMRFASGKLAEYWVSSDGLHLMAQLNPDAP